MNKTQGFALIELMAVIILVGIIATFSAFFLRTGFNGYLNTKNNTEGALNAQMALDRISMELRNISDITSTPSGTSVTYKSEELTGTRTLKYVGNEIIINVDATDYRLLDNISSFNLDFDTRDLDHYPPSDEEVAGIDVDFEVNDIGQNFRTNIIPRNMVKRTW
jgi:prepilin-type N-terminal cleavage/methylation domain-containing protein